VREALGRLGKSIEPRCYQAVQDMAKGPEIALCVLLAEQRGGFVPVRIECCSFAPGLPVGDSAMELFVVKVQVVLNDVEAGFDNDICA